MIAKKAKEDEIKRLLDSHVDATKSKHAAVRATMPWGALTHPKRHRLNSVEAVSEVIELVDWETMCLKQDTHETEVEKK